MARFAPPPSGHIRTMRLLFLAFLLIPIVEMALLIEVGTLIGVLPTIALVAFTATLGVALLRWQGFATWYRLQQRLAMGELPGDELLEGAMLLVGGALLLTPGFVTDAVGFVCLIPVLRRPLARRLLRVLMRNAILRATNARGEVFEKRMEDGVFREPPGRGDPRGTRTIDGEFREEPGRGDPGD